MLFCSLCSVLSYTTTNTTTLSPPTPHQHHLWLCRCSCCCCYSLCIHIIFVFCFSWLFAIAQNSHFIAMPCTRCTLWLSSVFIPVCLFIYSFLFIWFWARRIEILFLFIIIYIECGCVNTEANWHIFVQEKKNFTYQNNGSCHRLRRSCHATCI